MKMVRSASGRLLSALLLAALAAGATAAEKKFF